MRARGRLRAKRVDERAAKASGEGDVVAKRLDFWNRRRDRVTGSWIAVKNVSCGVARARVDLNDAGEGVALEIQLSKSELVGADFEDGSLRGGHLGLHRFAEDAADSEEPVPEL